MSTRWVTVGNRRDQVTHRCVVWVIGALFYPGKAFALRIVRAISSTIFHAALRVIGQRRPVQRMIVFHREQFGGWTQTRAVCRRRVCSRKTTRHRGGALLTVWL